MKMICKFKKQLNKIRSLNPIPLYRLQLYDPSVLFYSAQRLARSNVIARMSKLYRAPLINLHMHAGPHFYVSV